MTKQTLYLQVANKLIKIINLNDKLFNYFSKEFYCTNSHNQTQYIISIDETNAQYIVKTLPQSLILKADKKVCSIKGLEYFLKAAIEYNLLTSSFLFFHGSVFEHENKAFVFIGPSGAGKTTIIRKVPKNKVLGDDVVVIQNIDNVFFVHTSPFDRQFLPTFTCRNIRLSKVFVLQQAIKNQAIKLNSTLALPFILNNSYITSANISMPTKAAGINIILDNKKRQRMIEYYYSHITQFTNQIPIYSLYCTKNLNPLDIL